MTDTVWDIRRVGRSWSRAEAPGRYALAPEKIEMVEGRLLWDDDERMRLLGLLLENVGVDRTVQLGLPAVWWEAVSARVAADLAASEPVDDVLLDEPDVRYLSTLMRRAMRVHAEFVRGVDRRLSIHERELRDIERNLRSQR